MGPLDGYTVIELAGIGPAPMGGMILADMGANLIRVDRAAGGRHALLRWRLPARGRLRFATQRLPCRCPLRSAGRSRPVLWRNVGGRTWAREEAAGRHVSGALAKY